MGKIRESRNSGGVIRRRMDQASFDYVKNRDLKSKRKTDQAIERGNPKHKQIMLDFVKYLKNNGKAMKTIENYVFFLSIALKGYNGKLEDYSCEDWIKFFESRPETWRKKNDNNTRLAQVGMERLLEFKLGKNKKAVIEEILYSKYDKIKVPLKKHQQKDCLTYEEIKKLIDVSKNSRDRFFIYGLYETATRISEFLSIRLSDINFNSDPIEMTIRESKTETGEGVVVFINDAKPFLFQWLKDHPLASKYKNKDDFYNSYEPLIVSLNFGKPLSDSGALQEVKRLAERAGIKKRVYNHLFRKSRVTNLYRYENFDIYELKELGRWAKLDMLDSYIGQDLRMIGQKLKKNSLSEAEKKKLLQEENTLRDQRRSMEAKFCANCKTENSYDNIYCQQCGAPLTEKAKFDTWKQQQQLKKDVEQLKEFALILRDAGFDLNRIKEAIKN